MAVAVLLNVASTGYTGAVLLGSLVDGGGGCSKGEMDNDRDGNDMRAGQKGGKDGTASTGGGVRRMRRRRRRCMRTR